MPLVTQSTVKDLGLEDDEPYAATLQSCEFVTGRNFNDPTKPQLQLKLVLQVGDNEDDTIWVWATLTLGEGPNGVSRLRQMLNAFAGKPESTGIVGFMTHPPDDGWQATEWRYADGESFVLEEGMALVFRGINDQAADGSSRFRIQKFKPARAHQTKAAVKAEPVAVGAGQDDIPF